MSFSRNAASYFAEAQAPQPNDHVHDAALTDFGGHHRPGQETVSRTLRWSLRVARTGNRSAARVKSGTCWIT